MPSPNGKCEKCGAEYHGWYLMWNKINTCHECGGKIIVEEKSE